MRKGDIVLFAALKPNEIQKRIERQQKRWGSPDEHSRFTHAGLYMGHDHKLFESVPLRGVRVGSLEDRLAGCCLLVRRVKGLTPVERDNIERESQQWLHTSYGYVSTFLSLIHPRMAAYWDENVAHELVCSRFCDRAVTNALEETRNADEIRLHNDSWITPANLSESRLLEDVELEWQTMADSRSPAANPDASALPVDGYHPADR